MTEIPGPQSSRTMRTLEAYESRNVTFISREFPIAWERAQGAHVVDVDGNTYIDLTAAFGVAAVGHANPRVARAISDQASVLPHAMGDVHPAKIKATLLERLAAFSGIENAKIFLSSTGAEAVEAAMKTAMLATGRSRFASCIGGYHGLSFGTLAIAGIQKFRTPFATRIPDDTRRFTFGDIAQARSELEGTSDIAAVVVEPIQARGGCIVPPTGYLRELKHLCDEIGALLILDEIYTGFGRTGRRFAYEHEGVTPDILCVGKAMGGGFPIAATIARSAIMHAWPRSDGEALHTSTYLGNPMGCAAALAVMDELDDGILTQSQTLARTMIQRTPQLLAHRSVIDVRGRGAMWGIQLRSGAHVNRVMLGSLRRGVLLLPCGPTGEVLSLTPPLIIAENDLLHALNIIEDELTVLDQESS